MWWWHRFCCCFTSPLRCLAAVLFGTPWHAAGRASQRLDYCWALTSFLSRLLEGLLVLGRKFGNICTLNAAPLVLRAAAARSWRLLSCDETKISTRTEVRGAGWEVLTLGRALGRK